MKMATANLHGYPRRGAGLAAPLTLTFLVLAAAALSAAPQTRAASAPTAAVAAAAPDDGRAQEIDALLARYYKPDEPGASVIVTRHGAVLLRKAYGLANVANKLPLRPELSLRVGSLTKQFTAAAIMLLVERGKLAVTDEIGLYLPQFQASGSHVTIAQLLTHTSGIANYTALPQFGAVMGKDVRIDEAIAFFGAAAPEFQPGQRFSYSNSNYFLLGAIVQKVSGIGYAEFMQQQIFQPLQMTDTVIEQDISPAAATIGYTQSWRGIRTVPFYSMSWPYAAGALRTSVDDLARWDSAIAHGALLDRTSWARMATDTTLSNGAHTGYGYGWFIRKLAGSEAMEHGGDIGGFSADAWRFPKEELFIAVLTNNDAHHPAADEVAEKIAKIVLRR